MQIEDPPGPKISLNRLVKTCKKGQFGNLLSYYTRQKLEPWTDLRVHQLPPQYINKRSVLYIGCHDGTVPVELALRFQPASIEAIDIDSKLLCKAVERCKFVDRALTLPLDKSHGFLGEFASAKDDDWVGLLLKMREVKRSGPLLETIRFRLKNILDLDDCYRNQRFSTVFCLKLTKYVQLNFGDEGLKVLFRNLYELLEVGGILIFQPHTLESYKKFKSFAPICAENFKAMQIFPEHFESFLTQNYRFELLQKIVLENSGKKAKQQQDDESTHTLYFFRKCPELNK